MDTQETKKRRINKDQNKKTRNSKFMSIKDSLFHNNEEVETKYNSKDSDSCDHSNFQCNKELIIKSKRKSTSSDTLMTLNNKIKRHNQKRKSFISRHSRFFSISKKIQRSSKIFFSEEPNKKENSSKYTENYDYTTSTVQSNSKLKERSISYNDVKDIKQNPRIYSSEVKTKSEKSNTLSCHKIVFLNFESSYRIYSKIIASKSSMEIKDIIKINSKREHLDFQTLKQKSIIYRIREYYSSEFSELWHRKQYTWPTCVHQLQSCYYQNSKLENNHMFLLVCLKLWSDIEVEHSTDLLSNVLNLFLLQNSVHQIGPMDKNLDKNHHDFECKIKIYDLVKYEICEYILARSLNLLHKKSANIEKKFVMDQTNTDLKKSFLRFTVNVNDEKQSLTHYYQMEDTHKLLASLISTLYKSGLVNNECLVEDFRFLKSIPNFFENFNTSKNRNIIKDIVHNHKIKRFLKANYRYVCALCGRPLIDIGICGIQCSNCDNFMHIKCSLSFECKINDSNVNNFEKFDENLIEDDLIGQVLNNIARFDDINKIEKDIRPSFEVFCNYKAFNKDKKNIFIYDIINEIIFMHQKYYEAIMIIYNIYIYSLKELAESQKFLKYIGMNRNLFEFIIDTNRIAFRTVIHHDKNLIKELKKLYEIKILKSKKILRLFEISEKQNEINNEALELLSHFSIISLRYYNLQSSECLESVSNFARVLVFLKLFFANFDFESDTTEKKFFSIFRKIPLCKDKSFKAAISDLENRYPQLDSLYNTLRNKITLDLSSSPKLKSLEKALLVQGNIKYYLQSEYMRWEENYRFIVFIKTVDLQDNIYGILFFEEILSKIIDHVFFFKKVQLENILQVSKAYLAITTEYLILFCATYPKNEYCIQKLTFQLKNDYSIIIPPIIDISKIHMRKNRKYELKCFLIGVNNCFPFNIVCTLENHESILLLENVLIILKNRKKDRSHDINSLSTLERFKNMIGKLSLNNMSHFFYEIFTFLSVSHLNDVKELRNFTLEHLEDVNFDRDIIQNIALYIDNYINYFNISIY